MASQYYRILPKQPPMKMYGFEKLSPSDLEMALVRLQRHTYCSEFAFGERFQRCPSPPRPPPLVCPKAPQVGLEMGKRQGNAPISEKDLDRLVRRLRRSTHSVRIAKAATLSSRAGSPQWGSSDEEEEVDGQVDEEMDERLQKVLKRLSRPTTASSMKCFCPFCADPATSDYLDRDFAFEDRIVEQEELNSIIERLRRPTMASEGGQAHRCEKRKESSTVDRQAMDRRPLVCRRPRSRNVDEIVARLYGGEGTYSSRRQNRDDNNDNSPSASTKSAGREDDNHHRPRSPPDNSTERCKRQDDGEVRQHDRGDEEARRYHSRDKPHRGKSATSKRSKSARHKHHHHSNHPHRMPYTGFYREIKSKLDLERF